MSEQEEWGPWINDDDPKVGTYVQVKVGHDYSDEIRFHEGIVVHDDLFSIAMTPRMDAREDWTLIEWRERKPRGLSILTAILREVESDGGNGHDVREMEEVL